MLASVGADNEGKIYSVGESKLISVLVGHQNSVSKVSWNTEGRKVLTCSEDCTSRLWDLEGNELQSLVGH